MLALRGRRVVVVGGGPVGLRKARSLVEAGAKVTLVAEAADDGADLAGMSLLREAYRPETLKGAFLVFACTDDAELNARIADDARKAGAMVNVADRPDECDFFLPACVRDGDVIVAVGTGGDAPALAGMLKRQLEAAMPPRMGEFARLLAEFRGELKAKVPDARRRGRTMKQFASEKTYETFRTRGADAVRELFGKLTTGW